MRRVTTCAPQARTHAASRSLSPKRTAAYQTTAPFIKNVARASRWLYCEDALHRRFEAGHSAPTEIHGDTARSRIKHLVPRRPSDAPPPAHDKPRDDLDLSPAHGPMACPCHRQTRLAEAAEKRLCCFPAHPTKSYSPKVQRHLVPRCPGLQRHNENLNTNTSC